MKKTLVALAVTALAASAQAVTVYENDGTKVDVDGSLRLLLDRTETKVNGKKTKEAHSNLHNDGSRFGLRVRQELENGLYALGRLELRFDKDAGTTDQFGDLYAKRAYVGLGHKQFGEIAFGRQLTIGDDIAQSGFDYTYGVVDTTLTDSGTAVARYDYRGVEGLQLSVDYRFAEKRDASGQVLADELKNGYGAGAIYDINISEGQKATLAAGYTRDNYKVLTNQKHNRDAWVVGGKYTIQALTLALDGGQSLEKKAGEKETLSFISVGAKYQVTDKASIYGNYAYVNIDDSVKKYYNIAVAPDKIKAHKYMLGTDYQFHKQVIAFLEGRMVKATGTYDNNSNKEKATDKAIGVGLRVYW